MAVAMSVAKRYPLTLFFIIAFMLTWLFTGLIVVSPVFAVPGLLMPAMAAWTVTNLGEGRFGALKLEHRLKNWRVDPLWYLIALVLPLLLSLGIALGGFLVNADGPVTLVKLTPLAAILFVMAAGEEIGWRGYALPRLLDSFHPLAASIILGLMWGFWYLPMFFVEGSPVYGAPLAAHLVSIIALSVIFTWVYQNTRGSLAVAMLLHGAVSTFTFANAALPLESRWWLTAAVYLVAAIGVTIYAGPDLKCRPATRGIETDRPL